MGGKFMKGYFSDDALRQELNELASRIFGFDFEEWVQNVGDTGEYIPYSFEEDGRILSNASANIMKFALNGKEKCYIQIGTVMTAEDCRNRGYARRLIAKIREDYEEKADGIYLFGNMSALEFYEKIGFQKGLQYQYSLKKSVMNHQAGGSFVKVSRKDTELINHYKKTIHRAAINAELDQINKYALLMFYTADMEQVYYSKEIDCFICFETDGNILYLNSIISPNPVDIKFVLERIPCGYQKMILGFTPSPRDRALFDARVFDGLDDYRFFYIGEDLQCIEKERLFFPVFSHA